MTCQPQKKKVKKRDGGKRAIGKGGFAPHKGLLHK